MQSRSACRAVAAATSPSGAAKLISSRARCVKATCSAARAAVSTSTKQAPAPLQRHERLKDPAQIGARGASTVNVKDMGHAVTATGEDILLDAYMRLPVEQYYILDPQQIQFLSGNKFILSVPRVQLLGASLQPVIEVQVTSEQDAVVLQATDCQLNATGIMGGLDSKFALQFQTKLTWQSHTHSRLPHHQQQQHSQFQVVHQQPQPQMQQPQPQQPSLPRQQAAAGSNGNGNGNSSGNDSRVSSMASSAKSQLRTGWNKLKSVSGISNGSSTETQQQQPSTPGSITGAAFVQVWCEVVPPFHLMPREVLERSCNVVISGLVNSLLPWFMRQLAADYQKWAADASYRAARRLRTTQKKISG